MLMELEAYKKQLATQLREWISTPDQSAAFAEACKTACTTYLTTRTGCKKRRDTAEALIQTLNPENVLSKFLETTSEDCWATDHHVGRFFGCASLNTLLMYSVIVGYHQHTEKRLRKSEITEHYGEFIVLCDETNRHIKEASLQGLCRDIYRLMKPCELLSTKRASL